MSGLLRSARPFGVALLALALVVGINGLEGAVHSVHHLSAPVEVHAHDLTGSGHDEQGEAPVPERAEPCPLAAAASHVAAAAVEPPPTLAPVPAALRLVALGAFDAPRVAWREPGSGRAPPVTRSFFS